MVQAEHNAGTMRDDRVGTLVRRCLWNGLVALTSVFLALVMFEGAIRVFFPQSHFTARVLVWDHELGVRQIAGARGWIVTPEFRTRVTTNSKGLRDTEYSYVKPPGVCRILCLGDSYTFGFGVDADEAFPKVLEVLLNSSGEADGRYQVLNGGICGGGTANQLAFFNAEGYRYQPDFVVLCVCTANDFLDNRRSGLYSFDDGRLVKRDARLSGTELLRSILPRLPCYAFLSSHSHLMTLLKHRVGSLVAHHDFRGQISQSEVARRENDEYELTQCLLSSMRDSCLARGSTLVITVVPHLSAQFQDKRVAALVDFLKVDGFDYVDLFPAFREDEQLGMENFFPINHHWNKRGHGRVAEILCDFLTGRLAGNVAHRRAAFPSQARDVR